MAHAAFNNQQSLLGTQFQQLKVGGKITNQQTVTKIRIRTTDAAAKTTKNVRSADGTRPMSAWTRSGGVNSGVQGRLIYRTGSGPNLIEQLWQGVLAYAGVFPGSIPDLYNNGRVEALRDALGRFGENEVQLGTALQESKQTAAMVGKYYTGANQLAGKLLSAAQGSKRVRQQFRDFARNGWRSVPSVYLEYLFGVAPLADDCQNAMMVLRDSMEKRRAFLLVLRGKFQRSDTFRSSSWYSPDAGGLKNVMADFNVTQRDRAVLRFQLPDWYWDRLPPVTPFRQAWNTTSLSFVVDWALPISSWLSGFEGMQLRPFFRDGCVSTKMTRTVSGAFWEEPKGYTFIPERAGGRDYSYARAVFDTFPTEELFTLPKLRSELGLNQLRVGAALLGQRIASLQKTIHWL